MCSRGSHCTVPSTRSTFRRPEPSPCSRSHASGPLNPGKPALAADQDPHGGRPRRQGELALWSCLPGRHRHVVPAPVSDIELPWSRDLRVVLEHLYPVRHPPCNRSEEHTSELQSL